MFEREIKNAKIKGTMLGVEDHGVMSGWLFLDYDCGGQGFGGYVLDAAPDRNGDEPYKRQPHAGCGMFISELLEAVGVSKWEDLPGKFIRVDTDFGKVHRIGHIIEDKWFDPVESFKKLADKVK